MLTKSNFSLCLGALLWSACAKGAAVTPKMAAAVSSDAVVAKPSAPPNKTSDGIDKPDEDSDESGDENFDEQSWAASSEQRFATYAKEAISEARNTQRTECLRWGQDSADCLTATADAVQVSRNKTKHFPMSAEDLQEEKDVLLKFAALAKKFPADLQLKAQWAKTLAVYARSLDGAPELAAYQQALALSISAGDIDVATMTLLDISAYAVAHHDIAPSVAAHEAVLKYFENKHASRATVAGLKVRLAKDYMAVGNFAKANAMVEAATMGLKSPCAQNLTAADTDYKTTWHYCDAILDIVKTTTLSKGIKRTATGVQLSKAAWAQIYDGWEALGGSLSKADMKETDGDSRWIGAKVDDIGPFGALVDLRVDDVIRSVGGVTIDSESLEKVGPAVKDAKLFSIELMRGDKPITIYVNIDDK